MTRILFATRINQGVTPPYVDSISDIQTVGTTKIIPILHYPHAANPYQIPCAIGLVPRFVSGLT